MTVIEITNRDDLRVGDVATFAYRGHEFSGPLWKREDGRLFLGGEIVRYAIGVWSGYFTFVRATREAPSLPTEPGSVILVTECHGERLDPPVLAVCDGDGEWLTLARAIDGSRWHLPKHITAWTPAKVVPA
ncbi:hypothetical protein [Sanguibacter massiliensis]|uniref:hypothetical protein n=1 Tax=Sanguibacter massiliensis TaxID=1973217 RepID=UPI000C8426DC|nr:hypothetical protein [Sanguibacter massiliensis]